MTNRELAHTFIDSLTKDPTIPVAPNVGGRLINKEYLEELTIELQDFLAEVISILIDAGSERDAVNEAEDLHKVIFEELEGWSDAAIN